jgi:hypothetical protein
MNPIFVIVTHNQRDGNPTCETAVNGHWDTCPILMIVMNDRWDTSPIVIVMTDVVLAVITGTNANTVYFKRQPVHVRMTCQTVWAMYIAKSLSLDS